MPVGNDVVDFSDSDTDPATLHPRFDARVLAPSERSAVADAPEPNALRWKLWAAKEAAYKVARKLDASVAFSPVRFVVALGADGRGTVTHDFRRFEVEIAEPEGCVHAVARPVREARGAEGELLAGVRRLGAAAVPDGRGGAVARRERADELSREVRALAAESLAPVLGARPEELEFRRDDKIPSVWLHGAPAGLDLSLSHHGRVVAFAAWRPAPARPGVVS